MRPYYSEGCKTLAFEVAEQLGWRMPDRVVVPIASGSHVHQDLEGLQELANGRAGRRRARSEDGRRPGARLLAGRDGLRRDRRSTSSRSSPNTIAKSLAIGNPADGYYALKIIEAVRRVR